MYLPYLLQLNANDAWANRFFSSEVEETLPVVGVLSICEYIDNI